jgi:hypothetical protein
MAHFRPIMSKLLKLGCNIPCRSATFVTDIEVAVKSLGNTVVGMPKLKHSELLFEFETPGPGHLLAVPFCL